MDVHDIDLENGGVLRIIDPGGQQNKRAKWIEIFDDVRVLLYVSAISNFDVPSDDMRAKNDLKLSIAVFKEVVGQPCFANTPVVLILNKLDLFEKKIAAGVCLGDFLEGAPKASRGLEKSLGFIKEVFKEKYRKDKLLKIFAATAVDPVSIKRVIEAVQRRILRQNNLAVFPEV